MHILLDVSSTARPDPTGIGNYSRELIRELFAIDQENRYTFGIRPKKFSRRKFIEHMKQGRAGFLPLIPPVYAFLRGRVDLFHALHNRLPALPGFRKVVTIHDLDSIEASELFDADWAAKQVRQMELAISRADAIITPSQFTTDRLFERFPQAREKSFTIHHGVDHAHYFPRDPERTGEIARRYGIDRPYIFNVGAYNPRKNKVNLLRAFARARLRRDALLVLVGRQRGNFREVAQEAEDLGIADRVRFLGYVEREDIAPLIAGARIFAFPSIYEGFGLPILEAMACGTPVLSSKIASLPEVGGDAVRYCDVLVPEAMAATLDALWESESERDELVRRGIARAAQFTWRRAAEQTLDVYRRTAGVPARPAPVQPGGKTKAARPIRRVLLIAKDFPPLLGGGPALNAALSRILHDLGYELRVLTWTPAEGKIDNWPFRVERLPRASYHSPCPADRIPHVLAEFRPDAVLVSPTSKYMQPVFRALRKAGAPFAIYCHFLRLKHTRRAAWNRYLARRRYGYENAKLVVAVSEYLTGELAKMGVPKEKLRVVNPGIDAAWFCQDEELRARTRRELGVESKTVLLTVGRVIEGKGHERVIRALPDLARAHPELVYLIVGGGPIEEKLKALCQELGVSERVLFAGPHADPRPFYAASDVFVFMSDNPGKWLDTFGLTLVEAGAFGLPVVAASKGGPPEIVKHGETGFLVDPANAQELTAALLRLLDEKPLRERMGAKAREWVLSRFTLRHSSHQVAAVLEEFSRS